MKNLFLITIISCLIISCTNRKYIVTGGFYDKVLHEKKIFRDFLKYKGNQNKLEALDDILFNSEKVIIVSMDYTDIIYDITNDKYYLLRKYYSLNKDYRGKLRDITPLLEQDVPPTFLFVLEYVLNNKIEELIDISRESYDTTPSGFTYNPYIDILDVNSPYYKRYSFNNFMVHNGKPVMTHKEFLEA